MRNTRHQGGDFIVTRPRDETGSAIVGQVLTGIITLLLAITLAQFIYLAYVRIVTIDAAGEAARYAARFEAPTHIATARAHEIISTSAPALAVDQVKVATATKQLGDSQRPIITVTITSHLPLLGPWLPLIPLTAHGHALKETVN